jgi:hypothetical protein
LATPVTESSPPASVRTAELAELPLAALVFRLLSTRFTGIVTVPQPPDDTDRSIHFRGGMPVLTDWHQDGSRLGELALAQGMVSAASLDRAVSSALESKRRIGDALREVADIDVARVLQLLRAQTIRRLIDVFALTQGLVTMTPSDGVDDELLQVNVLELIHRGVTARYDVGRIKREMGPAFAAPLRSTPALGRYLEQFRFRPDDASLLGFLGTGSVATAAELTKMPDVAPQRASQIVYVLWTCRMIEPIVATPTVSVEDSMVDPERFLAALEELEQRIQQGTEPAAILELDRDADSDAIDVAWQGLARRFDPERLPAGIDEVVRLRVVTIAEALGSVREAARRRRHALTEIAGLRMVRDGKFARGLGLLTEAKALGPVGPDVDAAMCWATLQTGPRTEQDLRDADTALVGMITAHPDLVESHYYQACVASSLGRTNDAIAGFQRVLDMEPDHLDAQRQIRALRRGERPDAPKRADPSKRADAPKKQDFAALHVDAPPRHPLLTRQLRTLYWLAGIVLAALVAANIVLRLDVDF